MEFVVERPLGSEVVCISMVGERKADGTHLDVYAKDIPALIRALQARYEERTA